MAFLTHLESTADGSRHPADRLQSFHLDRPLVARYDLQAVRHAVSRDELRDREPTLWRYAELLPARPEHRISLGEGMTPMLPCPRLGARLGLDDLWIKDESQLPTGSFKARGMAMAVSMAHQLGAAALAAPTAGNAGGALAAYAARAGLPAYVLMPQDTPRVNQLEAHWHGAKAYLVDGLIHHCGAIVREDPRGIGWFDLSTMKEPYRLEGKKTMGLELAEQCGWRLPGAIFYPTGGGTGLLGMWKAFDELEAIGWLDDPTRPRMFACQADGCAPVAKAFEAGFDRAVEIANPHTEASGLRVPKAFADRMILETVRASGGAALTGAEARIREWTREAMALEGIALCPETAVCLDVLARVAGDGQIARDEKVVVFNTGAVQKYVEVLEGVELPRWSDPAH